MKEKWALRFIADSYKEQNKNRYSFKSKNRFGVYKEI